ncbi:TPA: hypothetical protein ACH3X2_003128 [Trebouxia sp. C0005]
MQLCLPLVGVWLLPNPKGLAAFGVKECDADSPAACKKSGKMSSLVTLSKPKQKQVLGTTQLHKTCSTRCVSSVGLSELKARLYPHSIQQNPVNNWFVDECIDPVLLKKYSPDTLEVIIRSFEMALMLQQDIVSRLRSLTGKTGSSASKQGSEGVSRKRKAPDAKTTMEGAMRAQFQMYAPDYAAQEWQDWKMDNHEKVNETCLLMEKNFDNKYKLDRPQMIAKIREHYNYRRKMARGSTPGTSSSMEDSSSVDASQAGKSTVSRTVQALPTQHVTVLCK